MDTKAFVGRSFHPSLPSLGRAIFNNIAAPSGSPANYEETRGCPSTEGWTKHLTGKPLILDGDITDINAQVSDVNEHFKNVLLKGARHA